MFISINTSKHKSGKVYRSVLLRESYREGKKVKKRTVANLSRCSEDEINRITNALRNKKNPIELTGNSFEIHQGRSIGGVYVLYKVAERLGIVSALGDSFHGKLALWLIIARILEQRSRLSATRLNEQYDIASVLSLQRGFDENNLYDCLHWLSEYQHEIEDTLFKTKAKSRNFFWYDVTSSYLEGTHNELAAFGYNRDKKKRKRIIVIGLLCQNEGDPIAIEAFKGNTQDTQTFENQLIKLKERFGCESVTMVCDRGLIREKQKKLLDKYGFHYITALPMPQILSLINAKVVKLEDFTNELKSIFYDGRRYVYRCNQERALETRNQRQERFETAQRKVDQENQRLLERLQASPYVARKRIQKVLKTLCVFEWVTVKIIQRQLVLQLDEEKLREKGTFDGCYIWTTDLKASEYSDRDIYERYKDLKYVEDDFRSFKTAFLEVRPIFVRSEKSTRGHLVVVMLAHMILRALRQAWLYFDKTAEEALGELNNLCLETIKFSDGHTTNCIPIPNNGVAELLKAVKVTMPRSLEECKVSVVTRRKVRKSVNH
jgi:transposase